MTCRFIFAALFMVPIVAASPGNSAKSRGPQASRVRYQLGLLVRGPTWTPERTARTDSIQAGHMANMDRMWRHGALVAAGPFEKGGDLRGVFVFRPGQDPIDSLMAGDSAIATRRLECKLYPWTGPAGFGDGYRRMAEERTQQGLPPKDSMVTFAWVMLQRGPRYASETSEAKKLIEGHSAHLQTLRERGLLLFSGSIDGSDDLERVLIMKDDSAAVARAVAADPAVKGGRFTARSLRWWTAWGNVPGH